MNCKCGTRALFFEKTTTEGTFNIFKCDAPESKKKGKCDFFCSHKIKGPKKPMETTLIQTEIETKEKENPRETYINTINRYIGLYKNSKHLPREYYADYIANMNYILKRLHMPLYFEDTETIESLEIRIYKNICVKHVVYKSIYPISLTGYPPELAVPTKAKCKKIRKIKSRVENQKLDFKNLIEIEEKTAHTEEENSKQEENSIQKEENTKQEEIDKKSVCSDDDSDDDESANDADNTFDIEDCDSNAEDSCDDTGAFSD